MNYLKKVFISSLFLLMITHHAITQTEDTTKVYQGQTVTVTADRNVRITKFNEIAARIPLMLQETPASIGVVTQQILKEQHATILSDALENISSVNIQNNLGTQDYFLIRGFESTSAGLILTDGGIEPDVSLFKFYGFGFYDLYNVDQVEVLKGPAAFLYGGNTLSGAINLVRKRPLFRSFAEVSLAHSRFQSYRETIDVGYAQPDSIYTFRVNGVWKNSSQFRDHANNRSYAINPSMTWNLKKYGSITANLEYVRSNIKPDIGIPLYAPNETWQLPEVPRKTSYQTPFDELGYNIFRFRLNYQSDFNRSRQLRNRFYFSYLTGSSRFTFAHIPYRNMAGDWVLDRHIYSFDEIQPFIGNQLELYLLIDKYSIQHKLLIGMETDLFTSKSWVWTTMLNTIYLFDPFDPIADFDQLTTLKVRAKTNARNLVVAPYLVDYITFSEKLHLFCGGRVDFIDFHTDRRNAPFDFIGRSLRSAPIPFSQKYLKFSPTIGIVIKDSENLWFYFNAGKSFAPSGRIIDEPEKSSQFEIGYKYATFNDKVRTSGAIYRLTKENISIPLSGPLQGNLHTSSGTQRSLGLELELTAEPYQDLYAFVTYSFITAELVKYTGLTASQYGKLMLADFSGNIPVFVPEQIANIWITKVFNRGFSCGLGIRYIGKQNVNLENTLQIGSYSTCSAMAGYKIRNYNLRINIENFTDKQFLTHGLGPYSVIPAGSFVMCGSLDVSF